MLLYDAPEGSQRFSLEDEALHVGRGADCQIRINDRGLSSKHCKLEPSGDGWKIVDMGSRNGTFVNDVLVKQRRLVDGDRVRLGRVQLRYFESGEEGDQMVAVGALVDRIHQDRGAEGVRKAADAFVDSAVRHGLNDLLATAEELRAAEHIQHVMSAMVQERRPEVVFEMIVDTMIDYTGAERGFFTLTGVRKGRKQAEPRVVAARNFDREAVQNALEKISRTVERKAVESGKPIIVTDAEEDTRFVGTDSIADNQLRSILCVPVRWGSQAVGTIYLDNRFERGVFKESQIPLIGMFADQAAVALRNAELHASAEDRLEELTRAKSEVEELNRILSERVAQTNAELMEVKEHLLRDRDEAPLKYSYSNIVGESRRMRELFHLLDKVTDSDVPVLVQGESGTGKELVARAIHFNGPRKRRPFISENCAAIPETLLESELFGYMKGAFTGAAADKKGLFEAANGGTLFLDEIGDMPMNMQKKLLRVLQEREVRPVGGKRTIPIDVRILAASNQNLRTLCEQGRFREDLYFRLNVITVDLPPLRERTEDIPLLVQRFLEEIAFETKTKVRSISEDAMHALLRHHWPGNVRELRNEIQRASALSDQVILPLVLSPAIRGRAEEDPSVAELGRKPLRDMVREVTEELERKVIQEALTRSRGRKAQAARLLSVSRPTLDAKIEAYGLIVKRT